MELELEELSRCLEMPSVTVERWIRQGWIPVKKQGSTCLFSNSALKKWARDHNIQYHPPGQRPEQQPAEELITLGGAVEKGGIYYGIAGDEVDEVLSRAVFSMENLETEDDRRIFLERLRKREQMMSTGVGNGVAIPHPRTPLNHNGIPTQIAVCFLEKPVDYRAVDKKPVHVLFVLAAKTSKQHLHLLSRISYCLRDNDFLRLLSEIPDDRTLKDRIAQFDAHLNGSG
ncbi:MAG: PTS sugar transporter subunit IIA [Desulfosalsimonas sp.]